ncbi:MAG TPA: tRNA-dihydrouridine synthase, partial [Polyangiaceae bacterium]|nr:tRNA-dihydrouridine synthase [Polyangiaceae bacterium]
MTSISREAFNALMKRKPVMLAPMEDVSDAAFRRICRGVGARVCLTEFVNAQQIVIGGRGARARLRLAADDRPTAVQIYGGDPAP